MNQMDMKELLEGLSYNEKRLLLALDKNNGRGSPADMIRIGGFGLEVEVMGSASWLASKGLAEISEESTKYFELTDPEASRKGLPERNALKVLDAHGGSITVGANKPRGSVFIVSFPRATSEETGI